MADLIEAYVSVAHYAEHLQPILDALPDALRGSMYAPRPVDAEVRALGIACENGTVLNSTAPILAAGYQDLRYARRPKVLVQHGAGQTYCLGPQTLVLRSDLRWVPISDLCIGDELPAFEEEKTEPKGRQWRRSFVLSTRAVVQPCYQLLLADGTKVIASADHRWLKRNRQCYEWLPTDRLRDRATWNSGHSTKLLRSFSPWQEDRSWGAAYLAAAFDGEGSFTQTTRDGRQNRVMLTFTQKENAMLETVEHELLARGFRFTKAAPRNGVVHLKMLGGSTEALRFIGSIRPRRLLANYRQFDGGQMRAVPVEVLESEFIGDQEVIAIETSTRTFFAEGYASHNCLPDGSPLDSPSFAGGPGHELADLFLCPSERVAALERARYGKPAVAVGCPKLDAWTRIPRPRNPRPTVAVTFHWDQRAATEIPEAGWAWPTWRDTIEALSKEMTVLGHAHPRAARELRPWWESIGVEYVPRAVDLLARADCLVLDNSSLGFEWAALDRPTVWLRGADWTSTPHGLPRFLDAVGVPHDVAARFLPGPELGAWALRYGTRELRDAIEMSVERFVLARMQSHQRVYDGLIDGRSARRAADVILATWPELMA